MIFRFGDYEVDSGRYELRCKGERVALEPKSLDVLLHLVRERHRLVSKQDLLDTVWAGVHVTESTLTRAVSLVRAAIGDSAQEPKVIETVAGRGYRWNAPVELIEPAASAAGRAPRAPRVRAVLAVGALGLALAALVAFSWPRPLGWLLQLSGSARPPHEPSLPAEPSVVVLPFRDLSPEGGHAYLAEGISEDLASALGRFPTLFVIARGSAASFQAADVPIETIGRELGVRYAVQGSVRAAGDQLVVTSQLVDAGTGVQVWANRVETRIEDALAVQARLAEEIVGVLGARIESAEIERLRRVPTEDLDAYELYVRARADFYAFTRESHARSRMLVEQALALDPDYPHVVALQAALELAPYLLGWDVSSQRLERARVLATRAVALDASSGLPHTTLALAHMSEGNLEQAVRDARTAVELGPNSDVCLGVQAATLSQAGHFLEALRSLDRALRLNPRHPELYWLMAGLLHAETGRRDVGIDLIERVREANPDMVPPRLALIYQYHRDADRERVEDLGNEIRRINPGLSAETALGIFPYAQGDPARAARALDAFRAAGLPCGSPPGRGPGFPTISQAFPSAVLRTRDAPAPILRFATDARHVALEVGMQEHYFLIASRDPYTHVAAHRCYELAAQLAGEGRRVTLFLVQNGVLPARPSRASGELTDLARRGVRVLADEFSLRERGIAPQALARGVESASLEVVIEALEQGANALWH